LPTTIGETTEVTEVTGPPKSLLVMELTKPCFVEVVVQVDAGKVTVTGITVVTTEAEVIGVGPLVTVWTVE
jgi:hypothetical protein